jgi:hypothetical protein
LRTPRLLFELDEFAVMLQSSSKNVGFVGNRIECLKIAFKHRDDAFIDCQQPRAVCAVGLE